MSSQQELIQQCADYLRTHYGEELVKWEILENGVADGGGKLTMNCTVRAGGGTSRWRKTFTFTRGRVTNMTWKYLGE